MAADVDVQYFSHLNGLTLGNNWGDLIRLLDTCLVNGLPLTSINSASIDAQGDVHITLYAAHSAMLFQVVELSGFAPVSLNQKYRIKGVPSATQLILKPKADIVERTITTIGAGKLASLGYEIIFRDTNDVKRVYRAKNPTAQHPFIRIDESLASGTDSYTSTYAKYAMVGLLEHMKHIDDYENPNLLQLPCDPADLKRNWKVTGVNTAIVRGWSRWYFARSTHGWGPGNDTTEPAIGNRPFTLCGDKDAFYMFNSLVPDATSAKLLYGCGIYNSNIGAALNPPWFLFSSNHSNAAGISTDIAGSIASWPLFYTLNSSKFLVQSLSGVSAHLNCNPILPDYQSGKTGLYSGMTNSALEIPIYDDNKVLRGSLKHVHYAGDVKSSSPQVTNISLTESTMLVFDGSASTVGSTGGCYFYLGDLE